MKIFADFYLYNEKNENIFYSVDTKLSIVIKDVDDFIRKVDNNYNFENLVIKWSELYEIINKNGDIPLFKLLRIQKKFKICYGGFIKFRIIYNSKEQFSIFNYEKNKSEVDNSNKLFSVFDYIITFLTVEDKYNLALINKNSYRFFLDRKLFIEKISFKNTCIDEDEEQNKLINFKKLFGGPSLGLYEVKKLGMFVGEKYIYLLIQSIETYNVEIMRLNKNNIENHEIIFRDNWTNYYMIGNTVYQIKNTKEKIKLNKVDKNDEINFISINVSNLGEDFDSEFFYYYKETKEIYIVTSELKIYKYNKSKKKLKLFFDETKKLKKFQNFSYLCKIRKYWKFYTFIKNKFFLSLLKFHIFDITNKKIIATFPEIRGVESIKKIDKYYYIVDYRFRYLLSDKNFEIVYKLKKYNNNLCCNKLLRIDPLLNHIQTTINDFTNKNISCDDKNLFKKLKLINLLFKFNDKYFCSDYYNDREFLYIKLYGIDNNNGDKSIKAIKKIGIKTDKFIKRLKLEENIKDNTRKEIINNIKYHLFFNGLGDIIINMNEYFWIYHYKDDLNDKNYFNSINENTENPLYTYNKIIVKANDIIRFQNIIFFDKTFIFWKQKSLKILYYDLSTNDINSKKDIKEEKNKFNKNVKILSLKDIEGEKQIEIETPIFMFKSLQKLFIVTNFSEENNTYDLFEIKLEKDNIILVNSFLIYMNINEKIQNDELLIFAKFILNQKYLVIFSSYYLYLLKNDENKNNNYKEIMRKEHNIVGYFTVKEIFEEETCFIAQDDRSKDCLFFDVMAWIKE